MLRVKYLASILLLLVASCSSDDRYVADSFSSKLSPKEREQLSSSFSFKQKGKRKKSAQLLSSGFSSKMKRPEKSKFSDDYFSVKSSKKKGFTHLESPFSKSIKGKKKGPSPLKDHFNRPNSGASRSELPSHFGREVSIKERKQLADHFGKEMGAKERERLPDHFGKARGKDSKEALSDHFGAPTGNKERGYSPDHFQTGAKQKEHTEKDLYNKGARKKFWRKNMTGERFRLINIDPNKTRKSKKQHRKKKRKKDPFSRNSKRMHRAQMPRGEGDLFPNGVLPKMDDPR